MCEHAIEEMIRLPQGISFCNICKISTEKQLSKLYSYAKELIFVIASFKKSNYCSHQINDFKKISLASPLYTCVLCQKRLINNTDGLYVTLNSLINDIANNMET